MSRLPHSNYALQYEHNAYHADREADCIALLSWSTRHPKKA
jgi:hypothetical protein